MKWDRHAKYRKFNSIELLISSFEVFVENMVDDKGRVFVTEEDVVTGLHAFVHGSPSGLMEIDRFLKWVNEDQIEWDGKTARNFAGFPLVPEGGQ